MIIENSVLLFAVLKRVSDEYKYVQKEQSQQFIHATLLQY